MTIPKFFSANLLDTRFPEWHFRSQQIISFVDQSLSRTENREVSEMVCHINNFTTCYRYYVSVFLRGLNSMMFPQYFIISIAVPVRSQK